MLFPYRASKNKPRHCKDFPDFSYLFLLQLEPQELNNLITKLFVVDTEDGERPKNSTAIVPKLDSPSLYSYRQIDL